MKVYNTYEFKFSGKRNWTTTMKNHMWWRNQFECANKAMRIFRSIMKSIFMYIYNAFMIICDYYFHGMFLYDEILSYTCF